MFIQKVLPLKMFYKENPIKNTEQSNTPDTEESPSVTYSSKPYYYNDLTFGARVDKGLKRFYEFNSEKMPLTVKNYIQKIGLKADITPLKAHIEAFIALAGISTIAGIQAAFPEDKELFSELEEPSQTQARRGILGIYRKNKDLLETCEEDILTSKENFTVWLVKKIFLEAKTLNEINEDFKKEMNPEFKSIAGDENLEIRSSTLESLGVKMPNAQYLQSLKYTREGYSDAIGDILSSVLTERWDSMSSDERLRHASVLVMGFNNWWDKIPYDEKLDMISGNISEEELLEKYKYQKSERGKAKSNQPVAATKSQHRAKEHIKTGITRDDLFKMWAAKHLEEYRANLSEEDKKNIEGKRIAARTAAWEAMTSAQKAEHISKLRSLGEQNKYAMIDAWNKNQDLIIKMSIFLKKRHVERPVDILYGTTEFNDYLSKCMSDFFDLNIKLSEQFGESIKESQARVKDAVKNGQFDSLKHIILQEKTIRQKEVEEKIKNYKEVFSEEEYYQLPEYLREFTDAYLQTQSSSKYLPTDYLRSYILSASEDLGEKVLVSWTRLLKKEKLMEEDYINIQEVLSREPANVSKINRALEAAIAEVLYDCTEDPRVFLLSHSDCRTALNQIERGENKIKLLSHVHNKIFEFPLKKHSIDSRKIDTLYKKYLKPAKNLDDIIYSHFNFKDTDKTYEKINELKEYLSTFGSSLDIAFSFDSTLPIEAKSAFIEKVINLMPESLKNGDLECQTCSINDFKRENAIKDLNIKLLKKYNFMSKESLGAYFYELNNALRHSNTENIKLINDLVSKMRTSIQDRSKIIYLNRERFVDVGNIFTFLCIEQALADILYEATEESKVYELSFEELIDSIEVFSLVKRFPSDYRQMAPKGTHDVFSLRVLRKPNTRNLNQRIQEYYKAMLDYTQDCFTNKTNISKEELLYILNPDENLTDVDKYTTDRIDSVFWIIAKHFNINND